MNTILSHKEKSVYFAKKMDGLRAMNKIEIDLSQEKIDFINDAYQKESQHWKKVALESVSTENEAKELIDLAPSRVCLIRKVKNAKMVNSEEQRTFILDIPSEENITSFEAITDHLKTFSKSMKEDENPGLTKIFNRKPFLQKSISLKF